MSDDLLCVMVNPEVMTRSRSDQDEALFESIVQDCGGLAHVSQLLPWFTHVQLRRFSQHRVVKGWYAIEAPPEAVAAVRLGGRLTCYSALPYYELWQKPFTGRTDADKFQWANLRARFNSEGTDVAASSPEYHVRIPKNYRRTYEARLIHSEVSVQHLQKATLKHYYPKAENARHIFDHIPDSIERYSRLRLPRLERLLWLDDLPQVLYCLMQCQDFETIICALDSALNKRLITTQSLKNLVSFLPSNRQYLFEYVDQAADSGLETLSRIRLREAGFLVQTQVEIPQVGTVDAVVNGCLVIELDGRKYHAGTDQFARDRERDLQLARQGFVCLRFTYYQVLFRWDEVVEAIHSHTHAVSCIYGSTFHPH